MDYMYVKISPCLVNNCVQDNVICCIYYFIQNDRGKYECRFLFVELKGYPPTTIVLEDNR